MNKTPAFKTITLYYEITTNAREHLGANGLDVWSRALAAELSRRFPGAVVDGTTRWSSVDASSYHASCVTPSGVEVGVSKLFLGGPSVGADPDELDVSAWDVIARLFADADADAWERACESV